MRNIKRAFFYKIAYEKAIKRGVIPSELRSRDIMVLFVIAGQKRGINATNLNKLLYNLGRSLPFNELMPTLETYLRLELVELSGSLYTISLSGLNMLKRFDDLLRVQRFDRRKI